MATLADYRSDLHDNLATAVDAGRWPNTLLDQALRRAVAELDAQVVYEEDFTVVSSGYAQDLSSISDLGAIVGLAYPWLEGSEFGENRVAWRLLGDQTVYFTHAQPGVGEIIRVRYTKQHTIEGLDSASATTAPAAHRLLVGLWAAAFACEMRLRQTGEGFLAEAALRFRQQAQQLLSHLPAGGAVRWGRIGLEPRNVWWA